MTSRLHALCSPDSVQITFLSGGTGTPKLLDGFLQLRTFDPGNMKVIVNTAEDIEISGNWLCPDLDTVLYTLAGCVDKTTWFGIAGDSHVTHERIQDLSQPDESLNPWLGNRRFSGRAEFMRIGDRDRATHILRSALLSEGLNLTRAIRRLADAMGVEAQILPMSHDPVTTYILTPSDDLHFQEFWVGRGGTDPVEGVELRGIDDAAPTRQVLNAFEHPVVIGPSNPITSIQPILKLEGVREQLSQTPVIMISPFVGERLFSGPADRFMEAEGLSASTEGVIEFYGSLLDGVILDENDPTSIDLPVYRTNTRMGRPEDRQRVAELAFETVQSCV